MTVPTYGPQTNMVKLYELPISLKDDALTLICGQLLGAGASRQTYEYAPNPKDTVIKVEQNAGWHQNAMEWHVWQSMKNKDDKRVAALRKWFAPVIRMSDLGVWLLMERTVPVTMRELKKEVKQVPDVITDLKVGNFGRLPDGRIVCHDYGTCLAIEHGLYNYRLRPATWWE